jgi:hypothetical protein
MRKQRYKKLVDKAAAAAPNEKPVNISSGPVQTQISITQPHYHTIPQNILYSTH